MQPQEPFSLNDRWFTEQWALELGLVPSLSVDTLLMYAYAQAGVDHVEIKMNLDNDKNPQVIYSVRLTPSSLLKWKAVQKAKEIKKTVFQKAALLALKKAGAPVFIEQAIQSLAKTYLPNRFSVEVQIVE